MQEEWLTQHPDDRKTCRGVLNVLGIACLMMLCIVIVNGINGTPSYGLVAVLFFRHHLGICGRDVGRRKVHLSNLSPLLSPGAGRLHRLRRLWLHAGKGDVMRLVIISLITALISAPVVFAECPQVAGLTIPCGANTPAATPLTPAQAKPQLSLIEPLFTPDNVAKESPPEQIEMLNHATWENAHKAALSRLYRHYKIFVATEMIMAIQQAIVSDVKHRYGLTDDDYMQILKIIAQEHGLPTVDLEAAGVGSASLPAAVTRALSAMSAGGRP